ncbi:helix-turn-helix transcriptional regulator [Rhizobium sp.]|uniref:helix-turn-helix transcriptional regulator n=1 Tax=Rhizobium sp. TaxID=391 RepID=UPI0028A9D264
MDPHPRRLAAGRHLPLASRPADRGARYRPAGGGACLRAADPAALHRDPALALKRRRPHARRLAEGAGGTQDRAGASPDARRTRARLAPGGTRQRLRHVAHLLAVHFKSVSGIAPLSYLTEWRMRLAERALREARTPIASVARSLGYTSESAFSNAFKRANGRSPSAYRVAVNGLDAGDEGELASRDPAFAG